VFRPSPDGLVHRPDRPVRQGLPVAGQETQIRDEGAQKKSQPQIRSNLHLQKYRIRVSAVYSMSLSTSKYSGSLELTELKHFKTNNFIFESFFIVILS